MNPSLPFSYVKGHLLYLVNHYQVLFNCLHSSIHVFLGLPLVLVGPSIIIQSIHLTDLFAGLCGQAQTLLIVFPKFYLQ